MPLPPTAFSDSYQIAYVTSDMERALAMLASEHGVSGFFVAPYELELRIPAATASLRVGVAWVGDLQIELIEPVDGAVDLYRAALPTNPGALGFHHLAMRISGDLHAWSRFRAGIADQRIALEGGREDLRFVYVDERASLGHFLEYVWMSERFLAQHPIWVAPSRRGAAPAV